MTLRASFVIPTHDRAASLARTLRSLAGQTLAPEAFEAIVVADGCSDDTVAMAKRLELPYRLRVVAQQRGGAAAARNFGARLAEAPLLIFLDDDMEASPGLAAAHLAAQRGTGIVGLGYFAVPLTARSEDPLVAMSALWWDRHFSALFTDAHRLSFKDVLSGNLAMPKALFEDVGGFDEAFVDRAGEDYELGARLMDRRVPARFVPAAASVHHDAPTLDGYCRRAFAEGRGHVLIARKHPALTRQLMLLEEFGSPRLDRVMGALRRRPALTGALDPLLRAAVVPTGALRLRESWSKLLRLLHYGCYWRGVVHECGSAAAVERLLAALPGPTPKPVHFDIDVEHELAGLTKLLERQPVDSIAFRYRSVPVGTIAPWPGAEPLRPEHVRHALVHELGDRLDEALRRFDQRVAPRWLLAE